MADEKKKEKRSLRRLDVSLPVDLKNLSSLDQGTLGDITPEGVFIATDADLKQGDEINIELGFPKTMADMEADNPETTVVTIEGEVMWAGNKVIEEERQLIRGIGVRFINLNAETFEIIQALYERLDTDIN